MLRPLLVVLALAPSASASDKPTADQLDFFEKKVRPVLVEHCYSCHGEKKQSAGLRLDRAAAVKQGADDGPVITPGDPAKSRLIKSVKREGDFPMPPKDNLPADAVAVLTKWVRIGAPFPEDQAKAPTTDPKNHWAFKPVSKPTVPAGQHPVDAFVTAKLKEKGLTLAPRADARTLVRRAYFDLIGLPPTAEEIAAFEKDPSPEAFARLVDTLLASPHYGERWGRYWLDVARYADTKGYVFQEDRNYPFAYTYRDYVVRSFNEDKPFDQFILEQLAADKLPLGDDKRPLAAMGFLTLGRRFLNSTPDIIDDRIDVMSRGLMGLTVSCARCHDHKYDPIPTKDYYSLYGVFASSTEPKDLPLIGKVDRTPELDRFEAEVEKRESEYKASVAKRHAGHVARMRSAAGVSDYLRAYLAVRGKPGERLQELARERDLSRFVLGRWKAFIEDRLKPHSPVFSPLIALGSIPEAELAAKAGDVLAKMAKDAKTPVNPLVLKALQEAKPKTIKDVTDAYGKLLASQAEASGAANADRGELVAALQPGGPVDVALSDFDKVQSRADRDQLAQMRQRIEAFKATNPAAPPRAMVLTDGAKFDPYVFVRGNQGNRGPAVPRQFPEVLAGPNRKPFADGSGRLELARAIASPDNPLTARVFVNRVWVGHFGHGLVRTPSDFGVRSDPPTHPELLDWLATDFMASGPASRASHGTGAGQNPPVHTGGSPWSVKRLHRLIMTSATYQQASGASAEQLKADPENRLLSRQNRRRLDFEGLRDGMLAASGKLDRTVGGRAVDLFKPPFTPRRSIYGFIDRQNFPGTFRAFDVASPDQHSPQRFQTTVPQQALFLMNSPFVTDQAKALASRPEVKAATTTDARIAALHRAALGRVPNAAELAAGRAFVAGPDHWLEWAAEVGRPFGPWQQYAQVLLLSNEFAFID